MEKTKLLTLAVIGLLLLNLGTLSFLFLNGKERNGPPGDRPKPKEIIIDKLHFDANQRTKYGELIEWHRGEITRLDNDIRQAKNKLYSQLSLPEINLKTKDSLITAINTNQKQIEQTHFRHFEDIKKLCNKNQLADFNALTEELSRIFAPKHHRSRHD